MRKNKRRKQAKKTKENIEMIKKYLEEHGESKTNDIAEHINLSPARTRALLKEIKEVQAMGGIVIGLVFIGIRMRIFFCCQEKKNYV